jgi:ribose transport system permease protein
VNKDLELKAQSLSRPEVSAPRARARDSRGEEGGGAWPWRHTLERYCVRMLRDFDKLLVPVLFVVLMVVLSILSEPFLSVGNMLNVFQQLSILMIVSAGMTVVIIGGGFDLSVGSVVALSGSLAALVMVQYGLVAGIVAGLAVGVVAGLVNGTMVAKLNVSPFIATLGTLVIARGLALGITGGSAIYNLPKQFAFFGTGQVWGIPVPVIVAFVILIIGIVVLQTTAFGLKIYAVGGNGEAARLSGIKTSRIVLATYVICGLTASLAGVVLSARLRAGEPTVATFMELFSIAAVVLGGTSLQGGEGSLARTLLGVLFIGFLENGLNLLNVPYYWQQVVIGTVFIVAAAMGMWRKRR